MKWTTIGTVESESDAGKVYEIKRSDTGALGCDCTAYRFARGANKTCKHIIAWESGPRIGGVPLVDSSHVSIWSGIAEDERRKRLNIASAHRAIEQEDVVVGGERLRVRRAIQLE